MKKSIYKKILFDTLIISLTPLILVMSVMCWLFCDNYKNAELQQAQKYVEEHVYTAQNEIGSAVEKSDNILKYGYIINNLSRTDYDNYTCLEFVSNVTSYLDNIMSNNVTIYTSNNLLFNSKYIVKLNKLGDYRYIQDNISRSGSNIYWDDNIYTDNKGKSYLTFFRELKLNHGSLISCRVYIPELYETQYSMSIKKSDDQTGYDIIRRINNEFVIAAKVDYQKIYRKYAVYIISFVILSLLFLVIIIYVTQKNAKRITMDIDRFIKSLDENDVLTVDIDFELKNKETEELAVIKRTIHSLILRVKEMSSAKYESELEKRELELKLIQSKIDPHVLYNSLSVIKIKATKYDDKEILFIINNLVGYYRAILSHGNEFVSINSELDMIGKFIIINEFSYGKKINLEVDIEPKLREIIILHLMLQPFVENAVIHGLGGKRTDCRMKISCQYEEPFLIFKIFDNGYGMREDKLNLLNHMEDFEHGYGIKNVYQRLKLVYGDESKIFYESELNVFTCVTIQISYYKSLKSKGADL